MAGPVQVWDAPVRILHWAVAVLVVADLVNEPDANPWHRGIGYAVGALVLARLAWGLTGSPYGRLSEIARRASHAAAYAFSPAAREALRTYPGLNPLGAAMALLLWTLLVASVATGCLLQLEAYWGDEALELAHAVASYALAGCALVHLLGVLATSAVLRVNLLKSMITGRKNLPG